MHQHYIFICHWYPDQKKNRHRKEAFFSGTHNETVNNEFQQQRLAPPNQLSFGPLVTFLLNR